jgi:DNA polymerase-3 subunit delta
MDFKQILASVKNKEFKPVYILHGEEPYFIDQIADQIENYCLEDHEKDFNQAIIYGRDAELIGLISELKGYPMMSERRLVILREAQDFKQIDELDSYVESPTDSTVFVVCYKYKTIDARKKLLKSASKNGIVFKSEKIKDYQLPDWIVNHMKSKGFSINSKATMLLAENVGNDLSRLVNEIEKLSILVESGTQITENHIEENIGISKDYNLFELTNAISKVDITKANKIVNYFQNNPKATDLTMIVSNLFKFFTQIMRIHFYPTKTREFISNALKVHPFVAGELIQASSKFPPKKIAANIEILYEFDLKSKGVNSNNVEQGELMKELIYRLLHA